GLDAGVPPRVRTVLVRIRSTSRPAQEGNQEHAHAERAEGARHRERQRARTPWHEQDGQHQRHGPGDHAEQSQQRPGEQHRLHPPGQRQCGGECRGRVQQVQQRAEEHSQDQRRQPHEQ
ncbi:MAG: hypothetical protein DLM59_05485, partial [Pseudonocardiales bacterium]